MTTPEEHSRLERWTDQVLRAQPLRRAPATLEERVMRAIAQPQWWRQEFAHWPLAARTLFVLCACGFVPLTLWAITAVRAAVGPAAPAPLVSAIAHMMATDLWLAPRGTPHWLQGAFLFGVSLYVALFALAAIAYRTLYRNETSSP